MNLKVEPVGRHLSRPFKGSAALAWLVFCLFVAQYAIGLLLAYPAQHVIEGANNLNLWERAWLYLPGMGAWAIVGLLIALRQPRHPIGWLFLSSGVLSTLGLVAEAYWRYALLVRPGAVAGGEAALWISNRPYELATATDLFIVLLFPNGRPLSRRWWLVGIVIVSGVLVNAMANAFLPGPLDRLMPDHLNPIGWGGGSYVVERVADFGTALTVIGGLLAIVQLGLRLRMAGSIERQQITLLALALAVYVLALAALVLQVSTGAPTPSLIANVTFVVQAATGILVASAVAVAILRHRLFDIDIIIRRTLVYSILIVGLGLVYLVIVIGLQALFVRLTGAENSLAVVASTLAIAGLFQPARVRVQRAIDRRFFRRTYSASQILDAFARRAQQDADLDALSRDVVTTVRDALEPDAVTLWLMRGRS